MPKFKWQVTCSQGVTPCCRLDTAEKLAREYAGVLGHAEVAGTTEQRDNGDRREWYFDKDDKGKVKKLQMSD